MSDKDIQYVQKTLGIDVTNGVGAHSHPKLALGRRLAREFLRDKVKGLKVLHVAANPIWWATHAKTLEGWSLNPLLDGADDAREVDRCLYMEQRDPRNNRMPDLKYCNHSLDEWVGGSCPHVAGVDVLLSVHSVYYLKPEIMLEAIRMTRLKVMYIVAHTYPTPRGNSAGGEMRWVIDHGRVNVSVSGGAHYSHDAPDWLLVGRLHVGDWVITAHPLREFDGHRIYAVTARQGGDTAEALSLELAVENEMYFGQIKAQRDTRGLLALGEDAATVDFIREQISVGKLWSFGAFLRVEKLSKQFVHVPKQIINAVAQYMVLRERTATTLEDCVRVARDAVRRSDLPGYDTAETILLSAVIGFEAFVKREAEVLRGINTDAIKLHNDAKQLKKRRFMSCFAGIWALFKRGKGKQSHVDTREFSDVCMAGRLHSSIRNGSNLENPGGACKPKVGMTVVGPAIHPSRTCASVARACNHNEELAVVNRGLMVVPPADAQVWREVDAVLFEFAPHLAVDNPVPPTPFNEWVARFPASRKTRLKLAKMRMDRLPTSMRLAAFVKRETILGKETYDPRLIQGTDLKYQAAFGPYQHSYQKALTARCRWDPTMTVPGVYPVMTSGMTAEELGALYTELRQSFPNHWIVGTDETRFDAHNGVEAQKCAVRIYARTGMPATGCKLAEIQAGNKLGRTPTGITYNVVATTSSGVPDTTVKGSILNAATVAHAVREHALSDVIVVLVNGDDNLIFCPEACVETLRAAFPPGQGSAYGYKISAFNVHRPGDDTAEFCSGFFWRHEVDGSARYIFGPKPGRQLAKLFVKVGMCRKRAVAAREIALGYEATASTVPVLHEVVQRVLTLTAGVKATATTGEWKTRARHANLYDRSTIAQFCDIYSCTEAMIVEAINEAKRLPLDGWLTSPLVDRLLSDF
jgi:hypothetical protein